MNDIKMFKFKDVQVVSVNFGDKIYFFPESIGKILGFENLTHSIRTSSGFFEGQDFEIFRGSELKDLKKLMALIRVGGTDLDERVNSKLLIPEFGLYKLIMRSVKPDAVAFQDWVFTEVLPSIRKTGAYLTEKTAEDWLNDPDIMIRAMEEIKKQRAIAAEAIKTKAWIGAKREATAMATASVATRQLSAERRKTAALEEALGKAKSWASTIAVSKKKGASKDLFDWRPLKKYCEIHGLEIKKEFNAAYESLNMYPAIAWKEVYGVEI